MDDEALAPKAKEGAALVLECVDHVHGCDSLTLGMLCVGDGVWDHLLHEHLEHSAGLLIDEVRDALDATKLGQLPDGRLGDSLYVVTHHLVMVLGAPHAQALPALAAIRHNCLHVLCE